MGGGATTVTNLIQGTSNPTFKWECLGPKPQTLIPKTLYKPRTLQGQGFGHEVPPSTVLPPYGSEIKAPLRFTP